MQKIDITDLINHPYNTQCQKVWTLLPPSATIYKWLLCDTGSSGEIHHIVISTLFQLNKWV